jgi:hypothetical protein
LKFRDEIGLEVGNLISFAFNEIFHQIDLILIVLKSIFKMIDDQASITDLMSIIVLI